MIVEMWHGRVNDRSLINTNYRPDLTNFGQEPFMLKFMNILFITKFYFV